MRELHPLLSVFIFPLVSGLLFYTKCMLYGAFLRRINSSSLLLFWLFSAKTDSWGPVGCVRKGKRLRCLMAYRKRVRFADCRKGRPARRTRSRSRVEDSKVRSGGKDFWRSTISVIFSFSTTSSNGRDRRSGENELPYHLDGHAIAAPALVAYRLPRNVEAILTKACLSGP